MNYMSFIFKLNSTLQKNQRNFQFLQEEKQPDYPDYITNCAFSYFRNEYDSYHPFLKTI